MIFEDDIIDETHVAREKAKARKLRRSAWWMRRTHEGKCYYCEEDVNPEDLTMDHVVPLSRGGRSKKGNLVPACKECNSRKKYLLPIEWTEYLETLKTKKSSV